MFLAAEKFDARDALRFGLIAAIAGDPLALAFERFDDSQAR